MKINTLLFASSLLALGLLSNACSDDDNDNFVPVQPANATGTAPLPANPTVGTGLSGGDTPETSIVLAGLTYETRCLKVKVQEQNSTTRTLKFGTADDYEKTELFFLGEDCGDSPSFTYKTKGSYKDLGQPTDTTAAKINNIDFTLGESSLTVQSEILIVSYNTTAFCGKTDWVLNQEVSLAGKTCDGITTPAGAQIKEVYAVEEDVLYFGDVFSFLKNGAADRPTEINRDVSYFLPQI